MRSRNACDVPRKYTNITVEAISCSAVAKADSSGPSSSNRREQVPRPLRFWHYVVLSLPFIALLYPPLYARWSPTVFGVPFFYAYQFAWIFLSAGLTALVYRSITR